MWKITPERENELIEKAAKYIVDNDLAGVMYPLYDYGLKYFGYSVTQVGLFFLFPYLPIFGSIGTDFAILMETDAKGNLERIIDRVKELEEKKREEAAKGAAEKAKPRESFLKRLKNLFSKK